MSFSGNKSIEQPKRGPMWLKKAFADLDERIARTAPVSSDSVQFIDAANGKMAIAKPTRQSANALKLPFTVLPSGVVVPGLIFSITPTIGGDPITGDPPPTLSIPESGFRYVILTLTFELTKVQDVYVSAATLESATISITSTAPTDNDLVNSTGVYKIILATFDDGAKQNQFVAGYIQPQIVDDGSGEAKGRIYIINGYPY